MEILMADAKDVPLNPTEAAKRAMMELTQSAMRNPTLPRLYANAFGIAASSTDVSLVLSSNGLPLAIIEIAWGSAKGLVDDLTTLIQAYEKHTKQKIKSPGELQPAIIQMMTEKNAKRL